MYQIKNIKFNLFKIINIVLLFIAFFANNLQLKSISLVMLLFIISRFIYKKTKLDRIMNYWWIFIALFLRVVIALYFYVENLSFFPDSQFYLRLSDSLLNLENFRLSTVISHVGSLHVGYEYLIIISKLILNSYLSLYLVNILMFIFSFYIYFAIANKFLKKDKYIFYSCVVYLYSPTIFIFTLFPLKDGLVTFLSAVIFYIGYIVIPRMFQEKNTWNSLNSIIVNIFWFFILSMTLIILTLTRIYAGFILFVFIVIVILIQSLVNRTFSDFKSNIIDILVASIGLLISIYIAIRLIPRHVQFLINQVSIQFSRPDVFQRIFKGVIRIFYSPSITNIKNISFPYSMTLLDSIFNLVLSTLVIYKLVERLFSKRNFELEITEKDLLFIISFSFNIILTGTVLGIAYDSSAVRQKVFVYPLVNIFFLIFIQKNTRKNNKKKLTESIEDSKILLIIPSLQGGGAEKVIQDLFLELSSTQNVNLVYWNGGIPKRLESKKNMILKLEGCEAGSTNKIITFFRRVRHLRSISNMYDIIINFNDSAILPGIFLNSKYSKIFNYFHNSSFLNPTTLLDRLYYYMIFTISHKKELEIIVLSDYHKNYIQDTYSTNKSSIHVLHNGFDLAYIDKHSYEVNCVDYPYFVYVGRLEEVKRVDLILKSYSRFHENSHRLLIIGEGSAKKKLMSIARELELTGRVIFLGHLDNPYYYIKKAKALILSSRSEGYPTVLAESIILGTPVISTNCLTGPSEILKHDNLYERRTGIKETRYGFLVSDISLVQEKVVIKELTACLSSISSFQIQNKDLLAFRKEHNIESHISKFKQIISA